MHISPEHLAQIISNRVDQDELFEIVSQLEKYSSTAYQIQRVKELLDKLATQQYNYGDIGDPKILALLREYIKE